ncbi:hypothetical protein [Rodentibacter haemolyticus]|uniref:RNA-binding protein n=1 Tax=Rodentibacter haemolyticus TaxID=2778911 RepID=A0ABX6UY27_9PAST|nr:hypothetical protein [Rodentibacter haemolyticus]QPB42195.1 hypothetical protein IHV77_09805 [Rodentibacter haemolyticus]
MKERYFFYPQKHLWDLKTIKKGYLAKIHTNDTDCWQFGDFAIVEIMEVNNEQRIATIKILESKGAIWNGSQQKSYKAKPTKFGYYNVPFDFFSDVKNEE